MTIIIGFGASASVQAVGTAREIAPLVDRSGRLLELQTALTRESFLSAAVVGSASLQVPLEMVQSYLNIDVTAELLTTRRSVDLLLASANVSLRLDQGALGAFRRGVDAGSGTLAEVRELFDPAIADVRAASKAGLAQLAPLSASVGDPQLQAANDAIRAINEAAETNVDRMKAAAGVVFPTASGRTASLSELAGEDALYRQAIERLSSLLEGDQLRSLEHLVLSDPDSVLFDTFVASLVAGGPSAGVNPSTLAAFSGGLILQERLDEVAQAVQHNLTRLGTDVERRSSQIVGLYVLGLLLATALIIAGAVLISRSVVRPLDALAQRARALVSGKLDLSPIEVCGPTEVATTTTAFNEAVANLGHLHDAIDAMARGDATAAVASAPAGVLGVTLTAALERLTNTIMENDELRERLAAEAVRDSLTGLANRRLLTELLDAKLRGAHRSAEPVGVLFLDLDGFKAVNDLHGHAAGDMVLRQAADRLTHCARNADVVARYGGDEFVVVGHTATSLASLRTRVERAMSRDYLLDDGCIVHCPASVGAAHTTARIVDTDGLLAAADEAMYAVKQRRAALVAAG